MIGRNPQIVMPNICIDRSAQQRRFARRWVPVALRSPAPGHAGR
jgi:hypothetical protein